MTAGRAMGGRRQIIQQYRANPSRFMALRTAKERREELERDLQAFDCLSLSDSERQSALRRQVRSTSRRYNFAQVYPRALLEGARLLSVEATVAMGLIWVVVKCFRLAATQAMFYGVSAVVGLAAAIMLMWLLSTKLGNRIRRRSHAATMLLFISALPLASAFITATTNVVERGDVPSGLLTGWDAGMAAWVVVMFWSTVDVQLSNKLVDQRCGHYDGLALSTVRLAGGMARDRDSWQSSVSSRDWCNRLEGLAAQAEYRVSVHERIPIQAVRLRAQMRAEALRVAEVFRAHKIPILRAYAPEDLDPVIESLMYGVEAMLAGDVQALLLNAPEHVPRSRVIRDALARRIPALILIAAAIWLPTLVGLTGTAAHSLSVLLFVPAVVALVSPQAASQLNETLAKVMTLK